MVERQPGADAPRRREWPLEADENDAIVTPVAGVVAGFE